MLKNYLTVALRVLLRSKGFTLINIVGLAVGISSCILISLYVMNELSYDRHYPDADRIFRVEVSNWATTPMAAGPYLQQNFPDVEQQVRFLRVNRALVGNGQEMLTEKRLLFADSSAFSVFKFPLIEGDARTALTEPNSIVLTREMATKYFGNDDPVGKRLKVETGRAYEFTVTGVMEQTQSHTHLKFDFLASFSTLQIATDNNRLQWAQSTVYTYVLMRQQSQMNGIEQQLGKMILRRTEAPDTSTIDVFLRPVQDIHLYSECEKEIEPVSSIRYVYILSTIAVFILLLAIINFVNLSTARSLRRAKEVAMRKTLGADRSKLIIQFVGESCIVSLLAMLLSVGLVELMLPSFNTIAGMNVSLFSNGMGLVSVLMVGMSVLVGVVAGSYPAFYLSRFQPVAILKSGGTPSSGSTGSALLRKGLIIFQFTISIVLIIGSILVDRQLRYVQSRDLGLNTEQVLIMPVSGMSGERYSALKSQLLAHSSIAAVTASFSVPGERVIIEELQPQSAAEKVYYTRLIVADVDFPKTFGFTMQSGRDFSNKFATDTSGAFMVNEKAVALFGWQSPIGKRMDFPSQNRSGEVVGVVKDFNFASLHSEIEPLVIHVDQNPALYKYISIRIGKGDKREAIEAIGQTWKRVVPGRAFEYYFLDESFSKLYLAESTLRTIAAYFTAIGVVIACLGLFGLVSLAAEQRTKEIGIRKVLGSTVGGIVRLIAKDFLVLVLLANVLAWPLSYYMMSKWLESFAYRIDIGVATFLLAGSLALAIAFFTLLYQAMKAATSNPVDALKYE